MWPCRRPAYVIVSLRFNQAACCSGRSTNSHSDRPLQLSHRGKLASLSSATSSPQHSEAYSPGSITSCPVFIFPLTPVSRSVLHASTLGAKPEIHGVHTGKVRILPTETQSSQ